MRKEDESQADDSDELHKIMRFDIYSRFTTSLSLYIGETAVMYLQYCGTLP